MRTSISDYEINRAWTKGAEADGQDVESAAKAKPPTGEPVTKSKVVEAEDKPEPKKTTARSKAK